MMPIAIEVQEQHKLAQQPYLEQPRLGRLPPRHESVFRHPRRQLLLALDRER
jgi:hypothetical protein